jgi:hypothetical protein
MTDNVLQFPERMLQKPNEVRGTLYGYVGLYVDDAGRLVGLNAVNRETGGAATDSEIGGILDSLWLFSPQYPSKWEAFLRYRLPPGETGELDAFCCLQTVEELQAMKADIISSLDAKIAEFEGLEP